MRTPREIRADLDAVNEEIEAIYHDIFPERHAELDRKRRRLEAELAESRAADELTPPLFGGQS